MRSMVCKFGRQNTIDAHINLLNTQTKPVRLL